MKHDAWMAPGDPIDDCGNEICRERGRASDAHFAGGRVGEKLDVLHRLAQFIERSHTAIKQRATVGGGLDTLSVAVEQAHAKCMLQLRD